MTTRSVLAAALLAEAAFVALLVHGDGGVSVTRLLALFAGASLAFLVALLAHRRQTLPFRWMIVAALLLRLPLLPAEPSLSDDVWRYLHDGRAQLAGVSPYAYAPADPATAAFRGPEHARINHAELPTIYPPAAQLAFALVALLGSSLLAWKLLALTAELALLAALAALLRETGRPAWPAALWAWHPLVLVEVAGNAHLEPLAIAPLLAALLLALRGRATLAGTLLGLSVAVKLIALPILPFLKRDRLTAVALGAAAALTLLYAPYLLLDGARVFGSLGTFAERWEFNGSVYPLLRLALEPGAARVALGAAFAVALLVTWRRATSPVDATLVILLAGLLLAPVVHPWYLLWVIPCAAIIPVRGTAHKRAGFAAAALAWSFSVVLSYAVLEPYRASGVWALPIGWQLAEYAPVYLLLVWGGLRRGGTRSARSAGPRAGRTPARTPGAAPSRPDAG